LQRQPGGQALPCVVSGLRGSKKPIAVKRVRCFGYLGDKQNSKTTLHVFPKVRDEAATIPPMAIAAHILLPQQATSVVWALNCCSNTKKLSL
jgi:hypothetical protein